MSNVRAALLWTTAPGPSGAPTMVLMHPDTFYELFLANSEPGGAPPVVGPAALWRAWWRGAAQRLLDESPQLSAAVEQGFVLRTSQLVEAGVSPKRARTLLRRREWSAPAPGTVAVIDPAVEHERDALAADRYELALRRHALACAATGAVNAGFLACEASAAVLHGLPVLSVPTRPKLLTHPLLDAHRRGKATISSEDIDHWYGVAVTSSERTVVDLARHDRIAGLIATDAALRESLVDAADLAGALGRARGWCGVRQAREIVAFADGRAESPLESLTRLRLHDDGFPPPHLQMSFAVAGQTRPYRVDLCWPDRRVILECDGRVKYREDQHWREKKRELALRRLGYRVERVVWEDVVANWHFTARYLWDVLGLD